MNSPRVIAVIPARYGSTRFMGKPLIKIAGKPMIQRVIEGTLQAKSVAQVIVATDHKEILDIVEALGVQAVMTDSNIPSGTDRIFHAIKGIPAEIVLNIQGDEPLISGAIVDELARPLIENILISASTIGTTIQKEELENKNVVKVVRDFEENAIYFSRFPIPYSRSEFNASHADLGCLKHLGLYGYRRDFLEKFCTTQMTEIEKAEGLEQLRALSMGIKMKVIKLETQSVGVDTPEDVIKVETILRQRGLA